MGDSDDRRARVLSERDVKRVLSAIANRGDAHTDKAIFMLSLQPDKPIK